MGGSENLKKSDIIYEWSQGPWILHSLLTYQHTFDRATPLGLGIHNYWQHMYNSFHCQGSHYVLRILEGNL